MLTIDLHLQRPDFRLEVREQFGLAGITAIMGPSGCGKTTLLRCIAGLEKVPNSVIRFRDQIWQEGGEFLPPEQRRVGYIFQDGRLFPHLSVLGNLQYGLQRQRRWSNGKRALGEPELDEPALDEPALDEIVDWLGIEPLLQRSVTSLSGGQRQRVAIGRALLMAPQLLLMDEPLAALDWAAKISIMPRLRELNKRFDIPVLVVSHDRGEMARLADELLLMDEGSIVERGSVRRLLSRIDGSQADDCALSVLEGTVVRSAGFGMTELAVDKQQLFIDRSALEVGKNIRVVISATEVSIALDPVERTSIQNRIQTTLDDIRDIDGHHSLLQLRLEEQKLLALITRRACHQLGLMPGMLVYAHFKASSLEDKVML